MSGKPVRLVDPWIKLGETSLPPKDVKCFSHGIHLTGEEDDDLATFCDPQGFAYSLTIDFLMSIGAGSLLEALTMLGGPGTVVPFEFAYTNDPAGAENPHWSGSVRLTAFPIVDAEINEATDFSMEMPVIGDVMIDTGGGPVPMDQAGLNISGSVFSVPVPADLAALKADGTIGDGAYSGPAMTTGQYVVLGDGSKASYQSNAWVAGAMP